MWTGPAGHGLIKAVDLMIDAVFDEGDRLDRCRAVDGTLECPDIGGWNNLAHMSTVDGCLQDHARAVRRIGAARLHGVEQDVALFGGRIDRREAAIAIEIVASQRARFVAGVADMIVAGTDKTQLETVGQIAPAKPFEGSVFGDDLHQRFQLRIILGGIARHVRMRNDHHIRGFVGLADT